jgi:hypothetical protein
MLTHAQRAAMRLGLRWSDENFAPAKLFGATPQPDGSYARIGGTPRVTGHNDVIGDCFPTACTNAVQTFLARSKGITVPINDQVPVDAYSGMTGYSPHDPTTDQGTDPTAGFAWWQANPIFGYKLGQATAIAGTDEDGIRKMISTRGGVLLLVALAIQQQAPGTWMASGYPGTWGRHAIWADSFMGALTRATTWGEDQAIDRSFFDQGFVLGAYALDLVAA